MAKKRNSITCHLCYLPKLNMVQCSITRCSLSFCIDCINTLFDKVFRLICRISISKSMWVHAGFVTLVARSANAMYALATYPLGKELQACGKRLSLVQVMKVFRNNRKWDNLHYKTIYKNWNRKRNQKLWIRVQK